VQKSRCRAQLDRPKASARGQIDHDELATILRQYQVEYEAVRPGGHCFDPSPLRDIDGRRRKGTRRSAAMRHPADDDRDQNRKAADQHDPHHYNQGFESAHLF
jgi:hypothetical protein